MNVTDKRGRKTNFQQGPWGVACKNGKFYEFTDRHVLVMRGWPDTRAWFKRRSHGWRPTRKFADAVLSQRDFLEGWRIPEKPSRPFVLPDGQLVLPGLSREEKIAQTEYAYYLARTAFVERIPREVREELRRYSNRRWHILNLFARCPGAMDLSRSNPALVFALASNWVFHKPSVRQPMRAARKWVWKKQRAILEWLGFPGSESVRKILAKIRPDALDVQMLLYLQDAITNPVCAKLLSHLPWLNYEVVMMASNRHLTSRVTPKLLEETLNHARLSAAPINPYVGRGVSHYELLMDTVRMADIVGWEKCPTTFCSLRRAKTVHDELVPRMNIAILKKLYAIPDRFTDPPFPGTEHIIPLMTPDDVCREGYLQKNCVASHIQAIIGGEEYIYRVERPIRGTAAIVLQAGKWIPSQFYKACNESVEIEVRRAVFAELYGSGVAHGMESP